MFKMRKKTPHNLFPQEIKIKRPPPKDQGKWLQILSFQSRIIKENYFLKTYISFKSLDNFVTLSSRHNPLQKYRNCIQGGYIPILLKRILEGKWEGKRIFLVGHKIQT